MNAELPTKEQLAQLYQQKGWDTLIWYTWRNALRSLPALGDRPLKEIWPIQTVKQAFAVCHANMLLASIPTAVKQSLSGFVIPTDSEANSSLIAQNAYIHAYASTYSSIHHSATAAVHSISAAANSALSTSVTSSVIAIIAAAVSTAASSASDASHSIYALAHLADKSIVASYASASVSPAPTSVYATSDYHFLTNIEDSATDFWFSQPLWSATTKEPQVQSKDLDRGCQQLSDELSHLGLDFLAEDLNRLWRNEANPVQPHWNNYHKPLPDEILNNAVSLREAILGD